MTLSALPAGALRARRDGRFWRVSARSGGLGVASTGDGALRLEFPMRYLSEVPSIAPGAWCFVPAYAGAPPGVCVLAQYARAEAGGHVFDTGGERARECHAAHAVVLPPERFPPGPTT